MAIVVQCSGCGGKFRTSDELAGKRLKCPKCAAIIQIGNIVQPPSPRPIPATRATQTSVAPRQDSDFVSGSPAGDRLPLVHSPLPGQEADAALQRLEGGEGRQRTQADEMPRDIPKDVLHDFLAFELELRTAGIAILIVATMFAGAAAGAKGIGEGWGYVAAAVLVAAWGCLTWAATRLPYHICIGVTIFFAIFMLLLGLVSIAIPNSPPAYVPLLTLALIVVAVVRAFYKLRTVREMQRGVRTGAYRSEQLKEARARAFGIRRAEVGGIGQTWIPARYVVLAILVPVYLGCLAAAIKRLLF